MLDYNAIVRRGEEEANQLNSAAEMRDLAQLAKSGNVTQSSGRSAVIDQIKRTLMASLPSGKAVRAAREDA